MKKINYKKHIYTGQPLSSIIKKMSRKDKKIVAKIFAKAMAKKYKR